MRTDWLTRALSRVGRLLLAIAGVLLFLLCVVWLGLKTEWARLQLTQRANAALAESFRGTIQLTRVGHVGFGGVRGVHGHVLDPAGRRVLEARGLDVEVAVLPLVWELLATKTGTTTIQLDSVELQDGRVRLVDAGAGVPSLAETFAARSPSPSSGGATRFSIQRIELDHVWVHGGLAGVPIDVDVHGFEASLRVTPTTLTLAGLDTKLETRGLPQDLDPAGQLSGRFEMPLGPPGATPRVRTRFAGRVRGVEVTLLGVLEAGRIHATLQAPSIGPERVAEVLPGSRVSEPLGIAVVATGTLQQPELLLTAQSGRAAAGVTAVFVPDQSRMRASLALSELDLASFDPGAPSSSLSVQAELGLSYPSEGVTLDYRVHDLRGSLAQQSLPDLSVEGSWRSDPSGGWRASGSAQVNEPGAPTAIEYRLRAPPTLEGPRVEANIVSQLENPSRLARLFGVSAAGRVEVEGEYRVDSGALQAEARLSLARLSGDAWSVRSASLAASARGSLERPELRLDGAVGELQAQGRSFEQVTLAAQGTPSKLVVEVRAERPTELDVSAAVALQPELRISNPRVVIGDEGGGRLEARVGSISVGERGVVVRDAVLNSPGGGRARLSAVYRDSELRELALDAKAIDLRRAADVLKQNGRLPAGALSARIRYQSEPAPARGHLKASWHGESGEPFADAVLELDATLAAGKLEGALEFSAPRSQLRVGFDGVELPERAPRAPADLVGHWSVRGRLALEDLQPVLELADLPVESAEGRVDLSVEMKHERAEPLTLAAELSTRGFELVGERSAPADSEKGTEPAKAPPSISGLDLELEVDLSTAERDALLAASLVDERGELVKATASASLPDGALKRSFRHWSTHWRESEFKALVWLLPREVSAWPPVLRPPAVVGRLSSTVQVSGQYGDLEARVMGRVEDFGVPDQPGPPLDINFSGHYSPNAGALRASATSNRDPVAVVSSRWQGDPLARFVFGQQQPLDLEATAHLDRFPVASVPALAQRRLEGHVSGKFELNELEPLSAAVKLASRDLSVAGVDIERSLLSAQLEKERVAAELQISGEELGMLTASLGADDALESSDLHAKLEAKGFQLRALRPLVAGSVNGLEGVVDAKLTGRVSSERPRLRGRVQISDAAAQLPALGQMFRDIRAELRVEPGSVSLAHLEARGLTGRLTARGQAQLDGFALRSARAELSIAEREKLPLTFQGIMLGDAWGKASVLYSAVNERRQRLEIDVDEFAVELPEVTPRGVQSLDPARRIQVGHREKDGEFVEIPLQPVERESSGPPSRWSIAVDLDNVAIHKGPGIEVRLGGELGARIGRRTRLDGRIDLLGGSLDVSGKEFVIESGSISFDGALPEQGVVVATARWDSPMEYTVWAEYRGSVQEGDLVLRSEPPLSRDEILSLIMFGTPGGSFGSQEKSDAAVAIGAAGGTVTKGLNRALSDISQLDVSTRVDTSTGEARPELVVQLTPRITGRVSQAIGEPAPGQSPDRTFVTLDFRLFRRWSLSAQVGDEGGSALDLIWRHRY